jgi:two-component system sensor histidine kinase KdpD
LPDVSPTTVALAFLLVVLATATVGRLWARSSSRSRPCWRSTSSFLPPLGTFTDRDPQNWIALFAFLVVA